MQTFVPHGYDFLSTAKALDYRRLGKQRVEAWQILKALNGESKGWVNHPAVKMWRGHERELALYGATMCSEWIRQGYVDNMLVRFTNVIGSLCPPDPFKFPEWMEDSAVILSHRSNLIRKFPEHYGPLWPDVPNDLPYRWPVA